MLTKFRPGSKRLIADLVPPTVVMILTLTAWGVSLLVEAYGHQHVDLVVMAVAVSVTLGRTELERPSQPLWLPLAVLPAAAAVASYVAAQMARDHRLGDVLFVVLMAVAIWVRRFGGVAGKVGTLACLPLVATLVTPYLPQSDWPRAAWSAVLGAAIAVIGLVVLGLARRLPGDSMGGRALPGPPASARTQRRLAPSTRMAVQMAVALALGFVIGRNLHAAHWQWPVLTAYIVSSGNQGRADVVHKGILRGLGAAGGTVAAALLTGTFGAGDHRAVAYIFAVLWIALAVRRAGYAYWAGCVTAALALIYGYFGQGGITVLEERLEGIGLGAVAGIAVAWFVLPIRTGDVLRRRISSLFEALQTLLLAVRDDPGGVGADQVRPVVVADLAIARTMQPFGVRARSLRLLGIQDRTADVVRSAQACGQNARSLVRLVRTAPEALGSPAVSTAEEVILTNLALLRQSLRTRERAELEPLTVLPNGSGQTSREQLLCLLQNLNDDAARVAQAVTRPVRQPDPGKP